MIGLGGQLGVNALGAFELAALQTGTPFVPHRGRPRSAISRRSNVRSAVSRTRIGATVSAPRFGSEVSNE